MSDGVDAPLVASERGWRIANPNAVVDRAVVEDAVSWALSVWPTDDQFINGGDLLMSVAKRLAEGGRAYEIDDDLLVSILRDRSIVVEETA